MFQFTLKDVIDSNNGDEEDVLNLKQNLQDLGYYKTPHYGMTGYTDEETFNGIKRFQKDHGLVADGVLKPGGETETALNERLKARESRSTAGNENDSRLENLRNSYQDKLQRKNLLSDSPQAQPSRAHRQTEEDTWGKLPETKDNKPLFEQQEEAAKPATMPQPSLQPDNLLTSEADKLDGRMQQLHEKYRDKLVRRNLLAPNKPAPVVQKPIDPLDNLIKRNYESIRTHENCIHHSYLDSVGKITAGCGINVDNWEDFKKQSWAGNTDEATIRKEYDSLQKMKSDMSEVGDGGKIKYNKPASYYKDKTTLRISNMQDSYQAKAREIMEPHLQYLKTQGIDFFKLPQEVQDAHYDMAYNLGPTSFRKEKWEGYYGALKANNYGEMATQSHRRDPSSGRNQYVYDLLMKAHNNRK